MNSILRKSNGGSTTPATTFSGLVDQLFEQNFNQFFNDNLSSLGTKMPNAHVPVNISETDKTFELELAAPGFNKEDFKVDVSGDQLTISLDHKEETKNQDEKGGYIRKEYHRQSFSRAFNLHDTIDKNNISATYRDGLLHVTLQKKEEAQKIARTINVA